MDFKFRMAFFGIFALGFFVSNFVIADSFQDKYGFQDNYFSAQPYRDQISADCRTVRSLEHKTCAQGSESAYETCLEKADQKMIACYNAIYQKWQSEQKFIHQNNLDSIIGAIFQAETTYLKTCNGNANCCKQTSSEYGRLLSKASGQFRGISEAECFATISKDPNGVPAYLPNDNTCQKEKQAALNQAVYKGLDRATLEATFIEKCAANTAPDTDTPISTHEPINPVDSETSRATPEISQQEAEQSLLDFLGDCQLYAAFGYLDPLCNSLAQVQNDESQKTCAAYLSCGIQALDKKEICLQSCPLINAEKEGGCSIADCLQIYGYSIATCQKTINPSKTCQNEYVFLPPYRDAQQFTDFKYTITDIEPSENFFSKDEQRIDFLPGLFTSSPRSLSLGASVSVYEIVYTGTNTVTLRSADGQVIVLSPESRLYFGHVIYNDVVNAQRLYLELGRAEIVLEQSTRKKGLLVQTPQAQIKATGTAFSVFVQDNTTQVTVEQNSVSVAENSGNRFKTISVGQNATVLSGQAPVVQGKPVSTTQTKNQSSSDGEGTIWIFLLLLLIGAGYWFFIRSKK